MFPLEIAETKMNQVLNLAKEASHPLQCIIEKI
jgi:ATP-dependent Clp protease adaptor protein ClpS